MFEHRVEGDPLPDVFCSFAPFFLLARQENLVIIE
jgi:hypothetical protein